MADYSDHFPFDDSIDFSDMEVGLDPPSGDSIRGSLYEFSWERGLRYLGTAHGKLVANFRPLLVEEITVYGDGDDYRQQIKLVRLERTPDDFVEVTLREEDLTGTAALTHRVGPLLPSRYRVYDRCWGHILPAMSEFSEKVQYRRAIRYSVMGWTEEYHAFVLPSMLYGITAGGTDPDIRMDDYAVNELESQSIKLWGHGVRPIAGDDDIQAVDAILADLLRLHPIGPLVFTQVMAGPLSPFGIRTTPPLIHLQGLMSSFKTSITMLCQSVFGCLPFEEDSEDKTGRESWGSTENVIQGRIHDARHMTLLVDDYKRSLVTVDPVQVIQMYWDGVARGRMAPDQRYRKTKSPLGLIISAGEDIWESSASMDARTLLVEVSKPDEATFNRWRSAFEGVRRRRVLLPLVGGAWLQWLAGWLEQHGASDTNLAIMKRRDVFLREIMSKHPGIEGKMAVSTAVLMAASSVVARFLSSTFPRSAAVYQEQVPFILELLTRSATERTETASLLSPYNWMLSAIQQAIDSDTAYLASRLRGGSRAGSQSRQAECVGWYDENGIYLTKEVTFSWLLRHARTDGGAVPFTWRAFLQGVREAHGPWECNGQDQRVSYKLLAGSSLVRAAVLPADALALEVAVEVENAEYDDLES